MDYPANVTATLRFDANKVPASTNYDMVSGIYTGAEKETTSGSIVQTFSNSGIVHDAALDNNLYTMTAAEYKMFLAGTKPEELYLNFGTISLYGKNLTNLRTSIKAGDAFEANGSYTVVVKLMPRFKYLFEDGKTGYLSTPNRKDHTAIAVVFAPGRAIALWDAAANIPLYGNISDILYKQQINDRIFPTVQTALDDGADGRHWTWDASGSTDGKIKANEPTLYPAFYQAGHFYEIGLPGHLGGKTLDVSLRKNNIWYLASLKEWKEVYSNLGFGIGDLKSANGSWNNSFLQYAFTAPRNNGISIARNDYTYYCTSTEFGGRNAFIFCVHNDASTIYIIAQGINSAYNFQYVRPFVAFDE